MRAVRSLSVIIILPFRDFDLAELGHSDLKLGHSIIEAIRAPLALWTFTMMKIAAIRPVLMAAMLAV
jgi:hypothetical protein